MSTFNTFLSLLKKDSVGGAADLILSGMPSQLSFLTIRERLLSDESGVGYPVLKQNQGNSVQPVGTLAWSIFIE